MRRTCASANGQLALDVSQGEDVNGERVGDVRTVVIPRKLEVKAAVNEWMSANLDGIRTKLALGQPSQIRSSPPRWLVPLVVKHGRSSHSVGEVYLDDELNVVRATEREALERCVQRMRKHREGRGEFSVRTSKEDFGLFYGDGIEGSAMLADGSVDLLLTDPPYSISSAYTCERQIPRRLRTNGSDFIMPKGDFGSWDKDFSPAEWTSVVVPKVRGWAVIFCAQAQIGMYVDILKSHGFNAVGTIVWHKTNPVPFNTRFKPVNAWEAGVVGKRPGTKFHGSGTVHNVFTYKSPSPQHRIHPTQKPLSLFRELIRLFSQQGNLVLDPFAGSATTVCAAIELGRKVIAFENDEHHYLTARERTSTTQLSI